MAPTKPSRAVARPPAPVSPRNEAPSKAHAYPPAHGNGNNILLAGYLAHEFLTHGTLFGELYDPAKANAAPTSSNNVGAMLEPQVKDQRYAEVSELLKSGEVHIPGIVNPSQLASFLNRKPEDK
ncbi:hypothetical protein L1987_50587 [Smallanthus sonchifolius]|uniref:Uncharacterized protein n=1 Tax=Smallanthus sonchifolius TaxID=185202 RepID=A0ACB9EP06_9ASTR|nr:hypothetical protein L1987_50587 [Smallanthus sonchifolius]